MTINEIQDEIIDEFSLFDDWEGKYDYIIDIGKKLPPLDSQYKTEENIIKGCQSRVWLHAEMQDDKVMFLGESDAVIVKGLIGLLIRVLSGHSPEEIAKADLYFIDRIGMAQHLAQTRANGLFAMLKQMKLYALAYSTMSN
ncbi:SufE family protein [Cytophagaceae bacterium DM2B3-1]|uniref:SufE family protein n=1 Tax=Xanthocytophaga flava TaxID=3048013 RepID=A0AAE3QS19_9BACT|nr:SufE family protein [Xanthocytophaga flavus]MDJ1473066.1 SufE family protein [Xanthocytophaga flavus]MDJ1484290.1 SufE family protein [Xanthocytophaga flavus]MDJ1495184.1 SufE family protein [Xanthocytophaga flavus]